MKRLIDYKNLWSLFLYITLVCCNSNGNKNFMHSVGMNKLKDSADTIILKNNIVRFSNIKQIYQDTNSTKWTDKGSFWWLYFEPGKVFFDFNPSCGYWFPTILKKNKIVFYWARNMNCNFNRGLDTSFKGIRSPEIGKAFGEVLLLNDTTLHVNYYYKEWVKKINEAEYKTIDTLFPSIFRIVSL